MIYRILPDESAAKSDYVRVIDNEGEDYLYPAKYFIFLDLPQEIERALRKLGKSSGKCRLMCGRSVMSVIFREVFAASVV